MGKFHNRDQLLSKTWDFVLGRYAIDLNSLKYLNLFCLKVRLILKCSQLIEIDYRTERSLKKNVFSTSRIFN